jgi:WD40 repeat protein/tetratricopeptide (TPR) repeat protein
MADFAYPNVNPIKDADNKITGYEFWGCGRYAVSENAPEGYKLPASKIMNAAKVSDAALILARESFDKDIKKKIFHKKDTKRKYAGESLHLAYLFALIHRARSLKLDIHTDIWCTGSTEVSDGKPFLKAVESAGFQAKLENFLSRENKDTLFIVPEGNIQPEHKDLCSKNSSEILSLEDFQKRRSEDKEIFQRKAIVKVQEDELFTLINVVFELGPNPYKGLEYFDENDADRFFGREDLTEKLFEKYQNIRNSPIRLMAILGPSGSGKSSAARAGLVYKIRRSADLEGFENLQGLIVFRPGEHPFRTFTEELAKISQPDSAVIVADQFEEIYTQCKDETERNQFVENLLHAASARDSRVSVIIILRTDFLTQTKNHHPEFYNAIVENEIIIKAMTRNQIRSVITEPARHSGYIFDTETVDRLISETERHEGALPLLEFALGSIWKGMEKGVQPADTLKKLNGVGGALASKAQEIYGSLDSDADRRIARRAFLSLINIGEGTFDTRRRVLLSEIVAKDESPEHVRNVLYHFSKPGEAYFITLSTDAEGKETAEITHEALFEHWDSLKQWLAEKREDLPVARDLEKTVQDWHQQMQDYDLLWRGSKLDSLKEYHKRNKQDMTELQYDFFDASEKRQKRNNRLKLGAIAALIILTFASMIGGFWANRAEKRAVQERNNAVQSELKAKESEKIAKQERDVANERRVKAELQATAFSSEKLFDSGKEFDALIEAIRAGKKLKETTYEIQPDIRNRIVLDLQKAIYNVKEYNRINQEEASLSSSIDFSPDNKMIATTDNSESVKIWTRNGILLKTITTKGYFSGKISFSPDSKMFISCVRGGNFRPDRRYQEFYLVQIWSIDGTLLRTFEGHEKYVTSAKYSPDGQMIASGSADNTLRLWTIDGEEIKTIQHDGVIQDICFSPDGKTIVTGGETRKGVVALWDIEGNLIKTFEGHNSCVRSVSFSPDGKLIASMDPVEDEVKIWKIDGTKLKTIKGNSSTGVGCVKFSPNGSMIATTTDRHIKLWNLDGELIETFGKGIDISFSPDKRTIASVSWGDGTINFWSLDHIKPETLYTENRNIHFSPDSKKIAIPFNNEIKLFSHDGILQKIFKVNRKDKISDIDFSPDGKMIAVVNGAIGHSPQTSKPQRNDEKCAIKFLNPDGSVFKTFDLWNSNIGYQGHWGTGGVFGISFKPDDNIIASSGSDGTIILWKYLEGDYGSVSDFVKKTGCFLDIEYSPDGKSLAVAHGNEIIVYKDNKELNTLKGHNDIVRRINFSPNGQMLVSASMDNTVRVWNLDGSELNILKCDETIALENSTIGQMDACFSPDGQRILTAGECGLRLWDLSGNLLARFGKKEFELTDEYIGIGVELGIDEETKNIIVLTVYNDSPALKANIRKRDKILAINGKTTSNMNVDEALNLIKGEEGSKVSFMLSREGTESFYVSVILRKIKTPRTFPNFYSCAKFSPDGEKIIAGNIRSNLELWSSDGNLLQSLEGHSFLVWDVTFSPDGKMFASASSDKTVKLWSSDGIELKTLKGHSDGVNTVAFSPDGQLLASGSSDGIVRIWKRDGTLLKPLLGQINPSYFGCGSNTVNFITPDHNRILLLLGTPSWIQLRNFDGGLIKFFVNDLNRLWFDNDGNVICSKYDSPGPLFWGSLSISPDNKMFASCYNKIARIWSLDGNVNKEFKGHADTVMDVCFAPDGKKLASCSMDQTVKLWDIDGTLLKTLIGHTSMIYWINFSPDGILASLDSKKVKLWNTDGTLLHTFSFNMSRSKRRGFIGGKLKFSPDGKKLAVFEGENLIMRDFDLDSLMKIACDWVSDYLNSDNPDSEKDRNLCDGIEFAGSVLIMQGENLARTGDVEGAIARFEEALERNPKLNFDPKERAQKLAVSFLITEGENLARSNKVQEAILKFQKAVEWNQELIFDPEERSRRIAGQTLIEEAEAAKETDKAVSLYIEAQKLDPELKEDVLDALEAKGNSLDKEKKLDEAVRVFQELVKIKPLHENAWFQMGTILKKRGGLDEAMTAFKKQLEVKPDHENAWNSIGQILAVQNKFNEALYTFRKQVEIKPDHNESWFGIGYILQNQGKPYEAIEAFKKVKPSQTYLDVQIRITTILAEQGELDKALEHLHNVSVDNDNDKFRLVKFEADLLAWQKRYDEAIAIYNRLIETNPDNSDLFFNRAIVADTMGNFEQYEKDLRRILGINPKDVNALNSLGYTLADRTDRYQEACDLLKQAKELAPENPFVLDSFGWVLYKMGNYEESLENLRKAYTKTDALTPEAAAENAAHLGEVLWAAGNKDEAKAVFEKAMQDFPENEKLKEAAKRFVP